MKKLLQGQTKKLSKNFIGPFKIIEVVSKVAYKLELPARMRVHNVFHVALLKEYIADELLLTGMILVLIPNTMKQEKLNGKLKEY